MEFNLVEGKTCFRRMGKNCRFCKQRIELFQRYVDFVDDDRNDSRNDSHNDSHKISPVAHTKCYKVHCYGCSQNIRLTGKVIKRDGVYRCPKCHEHYEDTTSNLRDLLHLVKNM